MRLPRVTAAAGRATVAIALGVLLLAWEVAARAELSSAIPPMAEVWEAVLGVIELEAFRSSVLDSLTSLALGYGIAVVVGVCLGVALGLSEVLEEGLGFYVNMAMSAPTSAFVPLMIAVFGTQGSATAVVVFFFSIFVILVSTSTGVRRAPATLIEMSASFSMPRQLTLRKVILPSAAPLILSGLRLGFGRAVQGLILGEILIAIVGIGALVIDAGAKFQLARVWALVVIILGFTLVVNALFELVERRVTGWARASRD